MTGLSPTETAAQVVQQGLAIWQAWGQSIDQFTSWQAGTVNGGPNGDGSYPLTNRSGATTLVMCPAKLATLAGLSQADIDTIQLADAVSRGALAEAERKATAYYQADAPTVPEYADIWANTGQGNALSIWDGSKWQAVAGGGGSGGAKATSVATIATQLTGSSAYAWQDALTYDITPTAAGVLFGWIDIVQAYSVNQAAAWGLRVLIDGAAVTDNGVPSLAINEFGHVTFSKAIDATAHHVQVQWRAATANIKLTEGQLCTMLV